MTGGSRMDRSPGWPSNPAGTAVTQARHFDQQAVLHMHGHGDSQDGNAGQAVIRS